MKAMGGHGLGALFGNTGVTTTAPENVRDKVQEIAEKVGDTVDKGIKTGSDGYKKMTEKSRLKKEVTRLTNEMNNIYIGVGKKIFAEQPDSQQFKTQFIGHKLGIMIIRFLRTDIIVQCRIAGKISICHGIPVAHKGACHIISLLFQQPGSHSAVHTAG
jgi:hypothetical protein